MTLSLCVDCRWVSQGGLGRFVRNLLEALSVEKKITLLLLHLKKDRGLLSQFSPHLIEMKALPYSLREQLELPLKIPKCDLFFSPHFNIPLLPILAGKRITTLHDTYHLTHISELTFVQKIYALIFYNAVNLLSDCVLTVSQFSRREILSRIFVKPKELLVVSNGVNLKQFKPILDPISLPKKFILMITNFKKHKNTNQICEWFSEFTGEEELVIVGNENRSEDDLAKLYSHASCLVLPSSYEGFGFPLVEALASGTPVLASNIEVLKEVGGSAVEYFDLNDKKSFLEGLRRVLSEKKKPQKGLTHIQQYDLEKWKKKICEIITTRCDCS